MRLFNSIKSSCGARVAAPELRRPSCGARVAAPELRWDKEQNGAFVTSLCRGRAGEVWIGTEGDGVSCFSNRSLRTFTTKDGLGDDTAYSLISDRLGRIWVGHLNHGVSVWNGKSWKNYNVTDGPLGERVYSMAVSPIDGDIWIVHNAGLTRYSFKNDTWIHYTRTTGLPTAELRTLAFDSKGNLYLGTQHDGIMIGRASDAFTVWQQIKATSNFPTCPVGNGLPSNFINDIAISNDDIICVATTAGLAKSSDFGTSWEYVRGLDWEEKDRATAKQVITQKTKANSATLLQEDYISTLAEDATGVLWIGYRQKGYEMRRMSDNLSIYVSNRENTTEAFSISAFLPLDDGTAILASKGSGVSIGSNSPFLALSSSKETAIQKRKGSQLQVAGKTEETAFPKVAGAPSLDELNGLLLLAQNHIPTPAAASTVVSLPDDCTTQGDWLGRYGRYWANLSGMLGNDDYIWGAGEETIYYAPQTGSHSSNVEHLHFGISQPSIENRRILETPPLYKYWLQRNDAVSTVQSSQNRVGRRYSEWNDHAQEYLQSHDGPNINITLKVPTGLYYLSLYNSDKAGHDTVLQPRDYQISIRARSYEKSLYDNNDFDSRPELVQSRWSDFWGGSYKRYMVKGPSVLTVQVNRNYSYNTTLSALFLDQVSEEPSPYFQTPAPDAKALKRSPVPISGTKEDAAAEKLWAALETSKSQDPLWWGSEGRLFYQSLARYYAEAQKRTEITRDAELWSRIGTCLYQLNLFPEWETMQEKRGLKTARSIEQSLAWDGNSDLSSLGRVAVTAHLQQKSLVEAVLENAKGCQCHPN